DGGEERESEGDTRNKVCCKSLLILTFRDIPNFIKPLSPCPHILFGELSTSIFSLSLSLSRALSLSLSLSLSHSLSLSLSHIYTHTHTHTHTHTLSLTYTHSHT